MLKTNEYARLLNEAWESASHANYHSEYKAYMTEYRRLLYGYKVSDLYCYPIDSYVEPGLLTKPKHMVTTLEGV